MKRIVFVDHLGNKVFQDDVFMEGNDYEFNFTSPTCVWFGSVLIMEEEAYKKWCQDREVEAGTPLPEIEVTPETTVEELEEQQKALEEKEAKEAEVAEAIRQEAIVAEAQQLEKEVEESEPETADNQSSGDNRVTETDTPESLERLPEEDTRGVANKRGKGSGKRKTT